MPLCYRSNITYLATHVININRKPTMKEKLDKTELVNHLRNQLDKISDFVTICDSLALVGVLHQHKQVD